MDKSDYLMATSSQARQLLHQELIEKNYLQPFNDHEKSDPYAGEIERITHGAMHAYRVKAWVAILVNMLRKIGHQEVINLTEKEVFYLQIAALAHDVARRGENTDTWEAESSEKCQNLLLSIGASVEEAYFFSQVIEAKDEFSLDPKQAICRKILQSADSLDIIRCVKEFDVAKMSLFREFLSAGKPEMLFTLSARALELIATQQDLMMDCKLTLKGVELLSKPQTLHPKYLERLTQKKHPNAIMPSEDIKKKYELKRDCEAHILADIKQDSFLNAFYSPNALDNQPLKIDKTLEQATREALREKADKVNIADDFVIKALRNGNIYQEYLQSLLDGKIFHPLRTVPKKAIVVTGNGPILRAEKKPQYTAEEKKRFSPKQATSMGTKNFHPLVFNFADSYNSLVGMIFLNMQNVLLSDQLSTCDFGTTGRLFDFDDPQAALMAFYQAEKTLFSKENLPKFKNAIENPKKFYDQETNECLARLRWSSDGSCLLFIAKDTLETRLKTQAQARILKTRLLERGLCTADFVVPICYYMPENKSLHLKYYTVHEQELDEIAAKQIARTPKLLSMQLDAELFSFLLALSSDEIKSILNNKNLLLLMKKDLFLLNWLIELNLVENNAIDILLVNAIQDLEKFISEVLQDVKNDNRQALAESIPLNVVMTMGLLMDGLLTTMNANDKLLFQKLIKLLNQHPYISQFVFTALPNDQLNFLIKALSKEDLSYFQSLIDLRGTNPYALDQNGLSLLHHAAASPAFAKFLLELGLDPNAIDKKGRTPLHYAAMSGNIAVIEQLVNVAKDVTAEDDKQNSPIEYAVYHNKLDIVKRLLLCPQIDPNNIDKRGRSILHACVKNKSLTVLKFYLEDDEKRSVDLAKADHEGNTFLHLMVMKAIKESAEGQNTLMNNLDFFVGLSVFRGFDLLQKNRNGLTILDLIPDDYIKQNILKDILTQAIKIFASKKTCKTESVTQLIDAFQDQINACIHGPTELGKVMQICQLVKNFEEISKLFEFVIENANETSEVAAKLLSYMDRAYREVLTLGSQAVKNLENDLQNILSKDNLKKSNPFQLFQLSKVQNNEREPNNLSMNRSCQI